MFFSSVFVMFLITTGCENSAQKLEKAEENVVDAEKELQLAEEEYLVDIENYKVFTSERIASNEKSIAEFNALILKEKKEVNAEYREKIRELETNNSEMKMKINDYRPEGKDNWQTFKNDFARDLDALSTKVSELGKDKK